MLGTEWGVTVSVAGTAEEEEKEADADGEDATTVDAPPEENGVRLEAWLTGLEERLAGPLPALERPPAFECRVANG